MKAIAVNKSKKPGHQTRLYRNQVCLASRGGACRSKITVQSVAWLLEMHPLVRASQRSPAPLLLLRIVSVPLLPTRLLVSRSVLLLAWPSCRSIPLAQRTFTDTTARVVLSSVASAVTCELGRPPDQHDTWSRQRSATMMMCHVAHGFADETA